MSYSYTTERPWVLTDAGQRMLFQMFGAARLHLETAGAVRMLELMKGLSGDTWKMLACADFLIEMGELREVTSGDVAGQYRVFVGARS